jgi:hypothetical protein
MTDNPLHTRITARLAKLTDIAAVDCDLLERHDLRPNTCVVYFEQHLDHLVRSLETYTALQRSTLSLSLYNQHYQLRQHASTVSHSHPVEAIPVPDLVEAYPVNDPPTPPIQRKHFSLYAVRIGRRRGIYIYNSGTECRPQVTGLSNCEFHGFIDLAADQSYLLQ